MVMIMKKLKKGKVLYLLFSIILIICSMSLSPLIECNSLDAKIFKTILYVLSGNVFLTAIINLTKIKFKKVINIFLISISLIISIYLYQTHSNDYKAGIENKIKDLFILSKNDSVTKVNSYSTDVGELELDNMRVHYIDVKQGDSTFIEFPNDKTMLIDAGKKEQGSNVVNYIKNLGYNKIDYVVGTHPDADHIGGLATVIESFAIGSIYMPKKSSTTQTYLNLLKVIKNKGLTIHTAISGVNIISLDNLKVDIISPTKEYETSNESSAVIKIVYKNRKFLFMADATTDNEADIKADVESDVVKVGHHGSDSSSKEEFVQKTKAKYAVISVGENSYHHPYDIIVKRWENIGAEVLRTDKLGSIVISTDGNTLNINNNVDNDLKQENSSVEIISKKISKGSISEIKIKGRKNTNYSIRVYLKSGVSKASGLMDKVSDDEGYVTWNFKLASNAKNGNYKIVINDGIKDYTFDYEIK